MHAEESVESQVQSMYHLYARDVYQFLLYFTGDRNDAEDLTQEVFMRLLKSLPRFEQRAHVKTWLLSIAKHVAVDHYRKRKWYTFFAEPFWKRIPSSEQTPDSIIVAQADWAICEEALQKLKPQYRMVVILRCLKELSIRETADVLGWSEAKVKVDYHRALKMLQDLLRVPLGDGEGLREWEGGLQREYAK